MSWKNPINRIMIRSDVLKEMEQEVNKVRKNLKVALDRQKNYAYLKITHKGFQVGEHVYL